MSKEELKITYKNYCDSHWIPPDNPNDKSGRIGPTLWGMVPIQHSLESFSKECKNNKDFYNKYTKGFPTPYKDD